MVTITGSKILTRTVKPPDPERRYRVSHPNRWECAVAWTQGKYPRGESGPLSFMGGVIFSYSTPIARIVEPLKAGSSIAMVTANGYTPTTKTKHLPPVRRAAIQEGMDIFSVDDIMADTEEEHLHNRRAMEFEALEWIMRAKRARDFNKKLYMRWCLEDLDCSWRYAFTVSLIGPPPEGSLFPTERSRTVWGSQDAGAMVNGLFESLDFSVLPVLADALQEAGFDDDDLLRAFRKQ